ncbi:hypothetical protein [Nonomuraea aurantiaca]|uniref:hypothetical protein n=1 Tax=Nonomuraea aurantiaca TaxID=2878562 RepID=UPI001CDA1215|nr:hypothetical protein [Nonomuraea aurantiaca]MCA2230190.1 hypothetical protein [Nonomuraea aurantiaca]
MRRNEDWYVIDVAAPGRNEVLVSNTSGAAIRPIVDENDTKDSLVTIAVDATQILHACIPCTCCGTCACREGGFDLCAKCRAHRTWVLRAEPDLERYQAACAGPEGWFVVTGSNTVHAVGCSSLASTAKSVITVLDNGCQHQYGHEPHQPIPIRADAIRGGKRCRVCSPTSHPTRGHWTIHYRRPRQSELRKRPARLPDFLPRPVKRQSPTHQRVGARIAPDRVRIGQSAAPENSADLR